MVSSGAHDMSITISKDLKKIYIGRSSINWSSSIVMFEEGSGGWKAPIVPEFAEGLGDNYPFLSPDNSHIYFSGRRSISGNTDERPGRKIWFSESVNGNWRKPKMIESGIEPKAHMAFPSIAKSGNIYFNSTLETGLGNSDIYCIKKTANGYGKPENLGSAINSEHWEFHPYISPEEDFLMFDAVRPEGFGSNDLYISFKQSDGTWSKAVNMGEVVNTENADMRPYLSPDGKYFFFCSNRRNLLNNSVSGKLDYQEFSNIINGPGNGSQDIYWVDSKIIDELRPVESKDFSEYEIVYTSDESGDPEIYLSDLEGRNKLKITNHKLRDGYAACSPNGKKIAFYAYHDEGKTWSIHTMNIDGSERKQLTYKKNVQDSAPRWSSDGNKIIFSRREGDDYKILTMDPDGQNVIQLKIPFGVRPLFTPSGKVLFYSHWDSSGEICIANADGSNIVKLTDNDYYDGAPDISPNGQKIVFSSSRSGNKEIYIMNADGTNQTNLQTNIIAASSPRFSSNGSKILFSSNQDGNWNIYIMNSDGSGVKCITNNKTNEGQVSWLRSK